LFLFSQPFYVRKFLLFYFITKYVGSASLGKREAPLLHQCSVALFPVRLWLPFDAQGRAQGPALGTLYLPCEKMRRTVDGFRENINIIKKKHAKTSL
jgi:hypothetical protein